TLACRPMRSTHIRGQIFPLPITPGQAAEVQVSYVADWSNRFFGIADGMVMAVNLGTAELDSAGEFQIDVPDFVTQEGLGDGHFDFSLNEPKPGSTTALLRPAGAKSPWLDVSPSYPPLIRFVADKR
ncbi:MAG: hypothetical protein WBQ94_07175, partial [Terracidiphilus sp.]